MLANASKRMKKYHEILHRNERIRKHEKYELSVITRAI
jgi:hypothetical protein